MFDSEDMFGKQFSESQSISSIKDLISSLNHRVNEIQLQIGKKIDRAQCLSICQKKASFVQLKHLIDQMQSKYKQQRKIQDDRINKIQQMAVKKINELGKKLRQVGTKSKQKKLQPQQLYLQSNETMFSLLVEQIKILHEKNENITNQLEIRNKKTVSMNNQVFKKIQKIQNSIQQKLTGSVNLSSNKTIGNSWWPNDRSPKATLHKNQASFNGREVHMQGIYKSMQYLQKQMINKANLKDLAPIVKQQYHNLQSALQQLRQYFQQSMQSTRRILTSQTQINKQISMGVRVGWWLSRRQNHQIAIWQKQFCNLIPEALQLSNDGGCIRINQQGLYLIKIVQLHRSSPQDEQYLIQDYQVMLNTQVHVIAREGVLRMQKNTQIRLILRNPMQIVFSLQKL